MPSKIVTNYGTISIDSEVIARIAGLASMDSYGIVGMAAKNMKDGIVELLRLESLTKGIKLTVDEDGLNLDIHIIVEYGTNIRAISDSVISTIKYRVEEFVGINVKNVTIFVEDVRVN